MKRTQKIYKIGPFNCTLGFLIMIAFYIILILSYLFSPSIYSITTARYGNGTQTDIENVETAMGAEDTESRFRLYFQWYNVIHEFGHGLLRYNSNIKVSRADEEQLVNDFAVAYWLYYGRNDNLAELENIVNYASANIKSDANENETTWNLLKKIGINLHLIHSTTMVGSNLTVSKSL